MTRGQLIEKTLIALSKLSDQKVQEVADFADLALKTLEDKQLSEGIQKLTAEPAAFDFLSKEEDIYTVNDLKERYK